MIDSNKEKRKKSKRESARRTFDDSKPSIEAEKHGEQSWIPHAATAIKFEEGILFCYIWHCEMMVRIVNAFKATQNGISIRKMLNS